MSHGKAMNVHTKHRDQEIDNLLRSRYRKIEFNADDDVQKENVRQHDARHGANGDDGCCRATASHVLTLSRTEFTHSSFGIAQTESEPIRFKAMRGPRLRTTSPSTCMDGARAARHWRGITTSETYFSLQRHLAEGALKL